MQTIIAAQWSDRVRWGKPSKGTLDCDCCGKMIALAPRIVELLDGTGASCEDCASANGILVYQG